MLGRPSITEKAGSTQPADTKIFQNSAVLCMPPYHYLSLCLQHQIIKPPKTHPSDVATSDSIYLALQVTASVFPVLIFVHFPGQ